MGVLGVAWGSLAVAGGGLVCLSPSVSSVLGRGFGSLACLLCVFLGFLPCFVSRSVLFSAPSEPSRLRGSLQPKEIILPVF